MKNNVEYILKMIISFFVIGVLVVLVGKLFIFLLPLILVGIVLYYLYRIFFDAKIKIKKNQNTQSTKEKQKTRTKSINKATIDAEIIQEKFDK